MGLEPYVGINSQRQQYHKVALSPSPVKENASDCKALHKPTCTHIKGVLQKNSYHTAMQTAAAHLLVLFCSRCWSHCYNHLLTTLFHLLTTLFHLLITLFHLLVTLFHLLITMFHLMVTLFQLSAGHAVPGTGHNVPSNGHVIPSVCWSHCSSH